RTQYDAAAVQFAPRPRGERSWRRPANPTAPLRAFAAPGAVTASVARGGYAGPRLPNPVCPAAPFEGRSLRTYRPAGPPACKKTAGFSLPSPPDEAPAQSAQAAKEFAAPAVNSSSRTLAAPVRLPAPAFHQSW